MEQRARDHLAKRLKELREYKGWTADDLAHESGVSIRTVSRLETANIENPRETTLVRLAGALEQTREALAGPRLTPEAMDRAAQTQLDTIEAMLRVLLDQLPKPDEEIDKLLQQALQRAAARDAAKQRASKTPRRRGKAP